MAQHHHQRTIWEKWKPLFWSYLWHMNQTCMHMTCFHFLPFNVWFQYSTTSRHKNTHPHGMHILTHHFQAHTYFSYLSMVSPYTQHINVQLSTILSMLYILNVYLNLTFYICTSNPFDIPCNKSFKEHLPEDGYKRWPKHVERLHCL